MVPPNFINRIVGALATSETLFQSDSLEQLLFQITFPLLKQKRF